MNIEARIMVLISLSLITSISCQMLANVAPFGPANPASLTAAATSPISVQLTWSSVEGAEKYLVERDDGDSGYFPVGYVPGETTSFEDFLVPAGSQVSYRIKAVTGSRTSGGKTVSVTTPQENPNPLSVTAAFDTASAQSQAVGPQGGSLSITDARGVHYTLEVPAGALDYEVTFTLTPVQEMQGLPLSGGMTAGVRIEPEGLVFDQAARLGIETPQPDTEDGLTEIAFAFDGPGGEFHFVPGSVEDIAQAASRLAALTNKSKMKWIIVQKTKSYGQGKGTPQQVRDQVKNHPPSAPADNLSQKRAAGDDSDLVAPLVDIQSVMLTDAFLLSTGRQVELEVAGASDWQSFNAAVELFQSWLDSLEAEKHTLKKRELEKREEAIWETLVLDAQVFLNKAAKDCKKSPNIGDAKRLVNQLLKGASPFYRKFAEKMHKYSFSEAQLKKLKAQLDQCSPSYKATGTQMEITYSGIICDLEKPFTVQATSAYFKFAIQLVPASAQAGSFTYSGTWFDVGPMDGGGSYTVSGADGNATKLILNTTSHTTSTPVGDVHGNGQLSIDLVPLSTSECGKP